MVDYDVVDKWDGKTLKYNIGNRVSGLLKIGFGGICIFGCPESGGVLENILDIAGVFCAVEGSGDLISGKHHYFITKLFPRIHPKYEE